MVDVPKHIAIIMDGNGRWAKKRFLPRVAGHTKGVSRVKEIVQHCAKLGVQNLTLFAFGRDNWQRPAEEVSFLMNLLSQQIKKEFTQLHEKDIKINFLGDKTRLNYSLTSQINEIENLTKNNGKLQLNIALDYSGTFDITQAVNQIIKLKLSSPITEDDFSKFLLTSTQPNPELLIRTSGEVRISNFMLWQCAYSEMYFTKTLWPSFTTKELDKAILWYNQRERRFGKISEQLEDNNLTNLNSLEE